MINETTELLDKTTLSGEEEDAAAKQGLLLPPPSSSYLEESKPSPEDNCEISNIRQLPTELHVNILTYLRAYDLATVQLTCRHFHDPALINAIVMNAAECVYPAELTKGFEEQPVMSSVARGCDEFTQQQSQKKQLPNKKGKGKKAASEYTPLSPPLPEYYTFEHLRNMELLVVARVLSRPEPNGEAVPGHYYVSKSWCKTALKWLEWQQERQAQYAAAQQQHQQGKKKKTKQQRLRERKYSDASPPWPNANVDLLCPHAQLQRCSNSKSARARRKILDKQAWKCLKKLYPESIPLEAKEGECLQCILEAETEKKTQQQRQEQLKQQRKTPLSQPVLRRFYTRTRGVPLHCVRDRDGDNETNDDREDDGVGDKGLKPSSTEQMEENKQKPSAIPSTLSFNKMSVAATPEGKLISPSLPGKRSDSCPLVPGLYCVVPRAWCYAWRKYMKTGEGGPLLPPDASSLLCDAHRLTLLPPHLEAYLYGETSQLLLSKKQMEDESVVDDPSQAFSSPVARRSVVGLSPPPVAATPEELGLSPAELAQQQRAMMSLERQREEEQRQRFLDDDRPKRSAGEQLDRENYCCVEILAEEEVEALSELWPTSSVFKLSFQVFPGQDVVFSTQPCRECDASGMANFCKIPKLKASLRAAHQARVRIYKEQKGSTNTGSASKPGVQLEY